MAQRRTRRLIGQPFYAWRILQALLLCGMVACSPQEPTALNTEEPSRNGYPPESSEKPSQPLPPTKPELQTTNDPLLPYQWHIRNTGQAFVNGVAGTEGIDLNLDDNYDGAGVLINVADTGLQTDHPDLAENVIEGLDLIADDPDNLIPSTFSDGDHGTAVAGIIGMVKNNHIGGVGIAPGAKILATNILASAQSFNDWSDALGVGESHTATADIINLSLGAASNAPISDNLSYQELVTHRLAEGRRGLGAVIVKSAGNEFEILDEDDRCDFARTHNTSCIPANTDDFNRLPILVVGAVNAHGARASYSSVGSNIWISGLGGEFGYQPSNANNVDALDAFYQPAIITTDVSGCNGGYSSRYSRTNHFDYDRSGYFSSTHNLNPTCNYTASFTGTSAAAPTVSGVIARLLQANPNLTHYQVRHILATSARKIDSNYEMTANGVNLSSGWVKNAAGFTHSDWYGFGLIDAKAAMMRAYTAPTINPTQKTFKSDLIRQTITNKYLSPTVTEMQISEQGIIRHMTLSVEYEGTIGDVQIALVSPANTESIVFSAGTGYEIPDLHLGQTIAAHAFYGEATEGTWRLKMNDLFGSADSAHFGNTDGTLSRWQLTIYMDES